MKTASLLAITCLLLAIGGCTQARVWNPEAGVPEPENPTTRIVLFAPVDAGPVANDFPEAELEYARDMAKWTDRTSDNIQSWVGETLPLSSDARWDEGRVGSAAGAHVVVLTEVLDVVEDRIGIEDYMIATVRMEAYSANNERIYENQLTGKVKNEIQPKVGMSPSSQPAAKAAWEACRKLAIGLGNHVEGMSLPQRWETQTPSREQAPLVDVEIGSMPAGADIYIDGTFRGNTPSVVPLPVRPLTLRIQRQGFQPWDAELTPESGMNINPALEPLTGGSE